MSRRPLREKKVNNEMQQMIGIDECCKKKYDEMAESCAKERTDVN